MGVCEASDEIGSHITSIYASCRRFGDVKRVERSHIMAEDVQGYFAITATCTIRPPPPEGKRIVID